MATDPEIAERARTVARLLNGLGHFVEELEDRRSATGRRRGLPIRSAGPAAEHNSRKQRGSGASTPGGSITISARWSTATMSPQSVTTNSTSGRLMADNDPVTREFGRLRESLDRLLVPTIAVRVPRANGPYSLLDPWLERLCDACRYTMPANETGLPGVSLPAGFDRDGLSIGVQFDGNFCREDLLLQIAAQIERARPEWFGAVPGLHVGRLISALCGTK